MAEKHEIVFKVRDPEGVIRLIPAQLVEKAILAGGELVSGVPEPQTARSKLAAMGFEEDTDDWTGIGIIGGVRKPKP